MKSGGLALSPFATQVVLRHPTSPVVNKHKHFWATPGLTSGQHFGRGLYFTLGTAAHCRGRQTPHWKFGTTGLGHLQTDPNIRLRRLSDLNYSFHNTPWHPPCADFERDAPVSPVRTVNRASGLAPNVGDMRRSNFAPNTPRWSNVVRTAAVRNRRLDDFGGATRSKSLEPPQSPPCRITAQHNALGTGLAVRMPVGSAGLTAPLFLGSILASSCVPREQFAPGRTIHAAQGQAEIGRR